MSAIINTLKAVGTTFECRQQRIEALPEGAPVYFVPEPGNTYDPLAISIRTEGGDVLGYIGRNDENRDRVRNALANGFVVARALKVGGYQKYDGGIASIGLPVQWYLGLRVQWYAVDGAFRYMEFIKEEAEDDVPSLSRRNGKQKPKKYVGCKYKGKEFRKDLALGNVERDRGLLRKAGNKARRAAFKRGEDIKPNHLREDCKYYHFIPCGEWHPFDDDLTLPYWKETLPRKNKYITEAEAYERRVG